MSSTCTMCQMFVCQVYFILNQVSMLCSYARKTLDGALDALCALIEFLRRMQTKPLTGAHVLSLFDCSINIAKMMIDDQDSAVPMTEDEQEMDVTLLFQASSKKVTPGNCC